MKMQNENANAFIDDEQNFKDVLQADYDAPNMWNINKYKNILFGKMIICFRNIIIVFLSNWFIKLIVFQNKKSPI